MKDDTIDRCEQVGIDTVAVTHTGEKKKEKKKKSKELLSGKVFNIRKMS